MDANGSHCIQYTKSLIVLPELSVWLWFDTNANNALNLHKGLYSTVFPELHLFSDHNED